MAAHVFHEIYLHLTWHTKGSRPLITPELEPEVFEFFRAVRENQGSLSTWC